MKRTIAILILMFAVSLCGIAGWNYLTVVQPVMKTQNDRIKVWTHFQYFLNPSVLCFDIRGIDGGSKIDVLSALVRASHELKDHTFEAVILQSRGNDRFILDGAYFKTLSDEWNPINTARDFPSHISSMDGHKAFPEVERQYVSGSGLFGSLAQMTADADSYGKEIERYSDFSDQWYGNTK